MLSTILFSTASRTNMKSALRTLCARVSHVYRDNDWLLGKVFTTQQAPLSALLALIKRILARSRKTRTSCMRCICRK